MIKIEVKYSALGMVVAKPVYNEDQILLLAAGTVLSMNIIHGLRKQGISNIWVSMDLS